MVLVNFKKNLKRIVNLNILKVKEKYFLSLEAGVDIVYVVNNFVDDEKAKKVLDSLTSISLTKGYYHFVGFGHLGAIVGVVICKMNVCKFL